MKSNYSKEFYEKIDWGKSDKQIAKEIGRHRTLVFTWRKKLGRPRQMHGLAVRHQKLLREARHWKWSSGIAAVAKQHGLSREWTYQIARKLGLRKYP